VAPDPNLATHLEVGYIAPGRDWAAVAAGTREWGREHGWSPASPPPDRPVGGRQRPGDVPPPPRRARL
jgi:hypothetical protein